MQKVVWVGLGFLMACQTPKVIKNEYKSPDSSFSKATIPKRPPLAITGSQLVGIMRTLPPRQRELRVLGELRRGNLPRKLRKFYPVSVPDLSSKKIRGYLWVTGDYLAVGSQEDSVRMPMNPVDAQRVADHFAAVLPTKKIVDLVYAAAKVKVAPRPRPPSPAMVGVEYIRAHNATIEKQLRGLQTDGIVAGHKKDVILSHLLSKRDRRVAIYGWHRLNGRAIQPESTAHHNGYYDYSHGIRLVHNMMFLDGQWYPVAEVLQDPVKSKLINYEGPLKKTRIHTECRKCP